MSRILGYGCAAVLFGGMVIGAQASSPPSQKATLALLRSSDMANGFLSIGDESSAIDVLSGMTDSQFFHQLGGQGDLQPCAVPFASVVTKEPAAYTSTQPVRGVVRLGDHHYGFALDSSGARKGYDLLRFDTNRNGDLTDDGILLGTGESALGLLAGGAQCEYSFVEVEIAVDGEPLPYAFHLSVTAEGRGAERGVWVEVQSAVYRDGEITLDGKQHRIVLLDQNSNGRFDDAPTVVEGGDFGAPAMLVGGDMFYVDPQDLGAWDVFGDEWDLGDTRQYVGPRVTMAGKAFGLRVAPRGDEIEFMPSTVTFGRVRNEHAPWKAMVYGEEGVLWIEAAKDGTAALPVGEWKLLLYTLDRTAKDEEDPPKKKSALGKIASVFGKDLVPKETLISARARFDSPAVKVVEGGTAELPFGPPYRAVVAAHPGSGKKAKARLEMSILDRVGAVCAELRVEGKQPAKPTFVIAALDGELVKKGSFEYG